MTAEADLLYRPGRCEGPLVWFDADAWPELREEPGAVLECGTCGYLVTTGTLLDTRHSGAPLLRSPA